MTKKKKYIYINLKKAYEKIQLLTELTGKKVGIREIEEIKIRGSRCLCSIVT